MASHVDLSLFSFNSTVTYFDEWRVTAKMTHTWLMPEAQMRKPRFISDLKLTILMMVGRKRTMPFQMGWAADFHSLPNLKWTDIWSWQDLCLVSSSVSMLWGSNMFCVGCWHSQSAYASLELLSKLHWVHISWGTSHNINFIPLSSNRTSCFRRPWIM